MCCRNKRSEPIESAPNENHPSPHYTLQNQNDFTIEKSPEQNKMGTNHPLGQSVIEVSLNQMEVLLDNLKRWDQKLILTKKKKILMRLVKEGPIKNLF